MKRITFIIIALALAWYMGGCGGGNEQDIGGPQGTQVEARLLGNLNGTYRLISTNCESTIHSFRIEQLEPVSLEHNTSATITILNDGGSPQFNNGDIIRNAIVYMHNPGRNIYEPVISSPLMDCSFFTITNRTLPLYQSDTIDNIEGFDMRVGDFWTQCRTRTSLCITIFR